MLTPEERRGALLVLGLIMLGAAWDASARWRPVAPVPAPERDRAAIAPIAPAPNETLIAGGAGERGATARDAPKPEMPPAAIPLNRASAAELEALPGIGPVLARRIVEHRVRHGPFRSLDELRAVRGVGARLIARLRGRLLAGP
ncbi:MAG: ComEA family DNA-binding protein [Candidatus Eisenbacteria bacterium]